MLQQSRRPASVHAAWYIDNHIMWTIILPLLISPLPYAGHASKWQAGSIRATGSSPATRPPRPHSGHCAHELYCKRLACTCMLQVGCMPGVACCSVSASYMLYTLTPAPTADRVVGGCGCDTPALQTTSIVTDSQVPDKHLQSDFASIALGTITETICYAGS